MEANGSRASGVVEASAGSFIELVSVSKSYWRGRVRVPVLESLDFHVPQGGFDAIVGPSGSGKTTLLNLISGIDQADSGKVSVAGTDISKRGEDALADWRLRHIGFVFQFYNLVQVLTAYENVELPLLLLGLTPQQRRTQVKTALSLVGLSDREDHYPSQLSGGQEQRVGIARAIVTDPTLIVADEPTGDLDRESADQVLELLARLNREFGKTILMVTHDPKAASVAKRIRRIDKGQLVTTEATSEQRVA
jgi:putative ABC transport system ATP-binding protein